MLPRAEFGKVYAENIRDNVLEFKEKIADLGEPKQASIDFNIAVDWQNENQKIRLFGYMDALFGDDSQVIHWHFCEIQRSLLYSSLDLLFDSMCHTRKCDTSKINYARSSYRITAY